MLIRQNNYIEQLKSNCDRTWVFHKFSEGKGSEKQIRFFKKQFDSRYMDFEDDFLAFLKKKEGQELAYWHRPKKSYADMSKFFESIRDTVQKDEDLNPLILDEEAWTEFGQSKMWASGYVWFPPPKETETGKDEASSVDASTKMLAGLSGSKLSRKGGGKKTKKKKKKALPHNVRRPRFTASVGKVLSCIRSGSADENTMKELIFQSNPTLSFYIPDH
eukprot:g1026.t1